MHRWICALLLVAGLSFSSFARTGSHSSYRTGISHSYRAPRSSRTSGHVRENRSYGTRRSRASQTRGASGESRRSYTHYRSGYIARGVTPHGSVTRDSHGRIRRSAAAKDAFKRQQPCPSTGRSSGACPGYVIDHVNPLECGGADAPSNMQWQTVANGKVKDKTERYCR